MMMMTMMVVVGMYVLFNLQGTCSETKNMNRQGITKIDVSKNGWESHV
jgi:hypothetical protein